jgi:hypothetical protein
MPGLTVRVVHENMRHLETEALVVGFHEDVRPLRNMAGELDWLLCGALSRLILHHNLQGRIGDAALLTSRGKIPAHKIFLVGLGPAHDRSPEALSDIAATVAASVLKAGVRQAAFEFFAAPGTPLETGVPALCSGINRALRGRDLDIVVLWPPGPAYDKISQLMNTCMQRTAVQNFPAHEPSGDVNR